MFIDHFKLLFVLTIHLIMILMVHRLDLTRLESHKDLKTVLDICLSKGIWGESPARLHQR